MLCTCLDYIFQAYEAQKLQPGTISIRSRGKNNTVKCKQCQGTVKYNRVTTNLRSHLLRHHSISFTTPKSVSVTPKAPRRSEWLESDPASAETVTKLVNPWSVAARKITRKYYTSCKIICIMLIISVCIRFYLILYKMCSFFCSILNKDL